MIGIVKGLGAGALLVGAISAFLLAAPTAVFGADEHSNQVVASTLHACAPGQSSVVHLGAGSVVTSMECFDTPAKIVQGAAHPIPSTSPVPATPIETTGDFCRVHLLPPPPDSVTTASVIDSVECFKTAEAAQASAALRDGVVLLEVFADAGFGGAWTQFTAAQCAGAWEFGDFNLIGWNDRIGSVRAYCGHGYNFWEHTYFTGASLQFSTDQSSLGALNDETSSWNTAW